MSAPPSSNARPPLAPYKIRGPADIPEPASRYAADKYAICRRLGDGMFHALPHGISGSGGGGMGGRTTKDGKRKPAKRLLATGRKINGTWQVRTFLRAANDAREPFWQTPPRPR
jgi:hypothetical protein